MENHKKMKRKREDDGEKCDRKINSVRKKKHKQDSNTTKMLKSNHSQTDSKSDGASKNLKQNPLSEKNVESKKNTSNKRKRERRKRNMKVLKRKQRKMNDLKCETKVTEKPKLNEKTNSVHQTPQKTPIQIPSDPGDFSANWEKLKQKILPPSKPTKNSSSKKVENVEAEKPLDIWFDDVDESLLPVQPKETAVGRKKLSTKSLVQEGTSTGLTKAVAIDCEFVGVSSSSWNGQKDMLARVSLVNQFGHCIYDTFVKPQEKVMDYRTWVSGVREKDVMNGVDFSEVCQKVGQMTKGRILVGHAISNDLKVLFMGHPKKLIRDTSKYKPFKEMFNGKTPSLKKLTAKVLGVAIQEGEHSSIQDAQATMRLYTMYKQKWEKELKLPRRLKQLKNKLQDQDK